MRDFVWDDTEIAASKEELTKLAANKKKHFVSKLFMKVFHVSLTWFITLNIISWRFFVLFILGNFLV